MLEEALNTTNEQEILTVWLPYQSQTYRLLILFYVLLKLVECSRTWYQSYLAAL